MKEIKLRPWTTIEVPIGALMRVKGKNSKGLIIGAGKEFVYWVDKQRTFDYCLSNFEYSTDHGTTWKPCGVEE